MQEADKFLQQYKDGSKICETEDDGGVMHMKSDRTVINKSICDITIDPTKVHYTFFHNKTDPCPSIYLKINNKYNYQFTAITTITSTAATINSATTTIK